MIMRVVALKYFYLFICEQFPIRSSRPLSPRKPRSTVTARVPRSVVEEDHGPEDSSTLSHHQQDVPKFLRKEFQSAIFLPRSGRRSSVLPDDAFIYILAYAASAGIDGQLLGGRVGTVMQASCQTNFDHQTLAPARAFSRESRKKKNKREMRQSGQVPKRTGLGHLISASP